MCWQISVSIMQPYIAHWLVGHKPGEPAALAAHQCRALFRGRQCSKAVLGFAQELRPLQRLVGKVTHALKLLADTRRLLLRGMCSTSLGARGKLAGVLHCWKQLGQRAAGAAGVPWRWLGCRCLAP